MEITLSSQIAVFLGALALGAILGLFYDVFRVFDTLLVYNFKRVFLEDLSYLILCAIAIFTYMLITSMGEIRGYILIAVLLGWMVFHVSISKLSYQFILIVANYFRKTSKHKTRSNEKVSAI